MSRDAGRPAAGFAGGRLPALCFLLLLLTGCRSGNCYLEAELRCRERELRQLRQELAYQEMYNQCLVQPQGPALPPGAVSMYPAPVNPLTEIVLGRHTGGLDEDRQPGDEALQVVVEPRDREGRPVMVPGSVHVAALFPGPPGQEKPFGSWDLNQEMLRRTWRCTLISNGYHIILPWKVWPETDKLHLIVLFTAPDGRVYQSDRTIVLRLPPPELRQQPPPKREKAPPKEETAPAPKTAEPTTQSRKWWHLPFLRRPPAEVARKPESAPTETPADEAIQQVRWRDESPGNYLSDAIQLGRPEAGANPWQDR